jgi:hypothetical protein
VTVALDEENVASAACVLGRFVHIFKQSGRRE